jgi:hypothetical protein
MEGNANAQPHTQLYPFPRRATLDFSEGAAMKMMTPEEIASACPDSRRKSERAQLFLYWGQFLKGGHHLCLLSLRESSHATTGIPKFRVIRNGTELRITGMFE